MLSYTDPWGYAMPSKTPSREEFKIEGDKLYVTTPYRPSPNFGGKVFRSLLVWEREK